MEAITGMVRLIWRVSFFIFWKTLLTTKQELLGDGYNVTYKKSLLASRGFSKDFDSKLKYCEHMFKKLTSHGDAGRQT